MRIKIAVAVDNYGNWNCFGATGQTIEESLDRVLEFASPDATNWQLHIVEADVPEYVVPVTKAHSVTPAESKGHSQ